MVNRVCTYCGSSINIENDHIKPRSRGGVTTTSACLACNRSKSDDTVLQWFRRMKNGNPYRWHRILNYQKGKSGSIASIARKVRDEK